jgi:hypothetical protein
MWLACSRWADALVRARCRSPGSTAEELGLGPLPVVTGAFLGCRARGT